MIGVQQALNYYKTREKNVSKLFKKTSQRCLTLSSSYLVVLFSSSVKNKFGFSHIPVAG